jgi:hypothetical protein
MEDSMQSTECPRRRELRQNVYSILNRADVSDGSQPSLLRLGKNPEWKSFVSLLYSHIRTCPICRPRTPLPQPWEAFTNPKPRFS